MSDLISRADAIERVRKQMDRPPTMGSWKDYDEIANTCYNIVIKVLEALPSAELPKGDLISRADVLKYPIRLNHYDEENGSREFVYGVESVIEYVESLPSADAVSRKMYDDVVQTIIKREKQFAEMVAVVRCKDCRHYAKGHCYMYGGQMNDDDYCSFGERSEQTEYKLPGHDEVMEALDKMTLRGDKDE